MNVDRLIRQPIRVIIDRKLKLTGNESLFTVPGDILVYTENVGAASADAIKRAGGQLIEYPNRHGHEQLQWLMKDLAAREINSVHCECGPTLGGVLLEAGVVDRLVLYQAPCLLGDKGKPLVVLENIETMEDRLNLTLHDCRRFDRDSRMIFTRG